MLVDRGREVIEATVLPDQSFGVRIVEFFTVRRFTYQRSHPPK
jgi:hypothetical protein